MVDKTELVAKLQQWGASIVRVADTGRLSGIDTEPEDLLDGFPRAVSIAVHLSDAVMDMIDRQPTPLYSSHYSRVNALLDDLAVHTTNLLQMNGARAFLSCESNARFRKMDLVSITKAVAIAAGIGWQGKSLLVVNPDFGPRIRLTTVLTDADLAPDAPIKNRCGKCHQCKDHCPAGAIIGATPTAIMPPARRPSISQNASIRCVTYSVNFRMLHLISVVYASKFALGATSEDD